MDGMPIGLRRQIQGGKLAFVVGNDTVMFLPWYAQGHLLHRSREIASAFARHGLGWLLAHVGLDSLVPFERGWLGHPARQSPYTQAEHLRMALGELGATFIKLGQALSTRSDLLPEAYVAELSKLQDKAPPVPFPEIYNIIRQELGRLPDELFAAFDPEPLASASIGQVHAGRLEDGRQIIVKVRRPGVAEQVEEDLQILGGMASWAARHTSFGRDYNLPDIVEAFAFTLRGELDYRREGHNIEQFRQNFAEDARVIIPRVYWDYCSGRVLTMQRVGGIKVANVAALDEAGIEQRVVADNAVQLMLRQLFEFGFFHADPHPGNFFVQPDGAIALIDFGMVGRLDQQLQDTLLRLGLAVARQDAQRMADEFYALGIARRDANRVALHRDLDHLLSRYAGRPLQELAAREVTDEVMASAFRHHLQLSAEQKSDGSAYDGPGEGRSWPILTGERGHYELAAGRDLLPLIEALEKFANDGGMLPEQLWGAGDLPGETMQRGGPTGSAMPLCWSHAEYVTLVRSHKDGGSFDRIEPVSQHYVKARTGSKIDMWTLDHQPQRIAKGKTLRIITEKAAKIHWSFDGWATANDMETRAAGFGCCFADLPSDQLQAGPSIVFTFLWQEEWEGKDFHVAIAESIPTRKTA